MSDKSNEKILEQSVSMLERAVRFRFALILVAFILSANFALQASYKISIIDFDLKFSGHEPMMTLEIKTGAILVFLGLFLFILTGIIPIIRSFTERVLTQCRVLSIYRFLSDQKRSSHKSIYYRGYAQLADSENEALRSQNSFWTARNDLKAAQIKRDAKESELMANVSFMCLLVLIAEYFSFKETSLPAIISKWLVGNTEITNGILMLLVGIGAFILALPWWIYFLNQNEFSENWILHPELARKRYDEIEQREKEEREWKREIDEKIRKSRLRPSEQSSINPF